MNITAHHLLNKLTAVQLRSYSSFVQKQPTGQPGVARNPARTAQIATAGGSRAGRIEVPVNLQAITINADRGTV